MRASPIAVSPSGQYPSAVTNFLDASCVAFSWPEGIDGVIGAGCAGGKKKLKSYEGVQESQDWVTQELKGEFTEISRRNESMA
ncbi:uncharacterized protein UHOR_14581 [Ustilago hordei]|uniref:Uncharacterized protein n=1 Tax=Ustilago hordei TaxID=120017 RepID=I2FUX8_USTHO|nr:uncharacterized protein UHOR_14581 [Ustilago hordei]